jgi:hypothetical protein
VLITFSGWFERVFATHWFHSLDLEMRLDKLRYLVLLKPHPLADAIEGKTHKDSCDCGMKNPIAGEPGVGG